MAKPLTATEFRRIASRLKRRGHTVKFYPGWETRGRPYAFGPINGFMWHHTGSDSQSDSYLKFLFVNGRLGIPGPLCQFAIRSNGEIWIGALGRANHAGRGSSRTLSRVMRESHDGYDGEIMPGPDDMDGNTRYLGVEIMYSGFHDMSRAQYNAATALAAEVMREFGPNWTALSSIGHREHSARKWDPGSHLLNVMRRSTRTVLNSGGDWLSMATKADVKNAVREVLTEDHLIPRADGSNGKTSITTRLRYDGMRIHRLYERLSPRWIANSVWRTDGVVDAPPDHADADSNTHWYGSNHMKHQTNQVMHVLPTELQALRGVVEAALAGSQGEDATQILERIDQMAAQASAERAELVDALTEARTALITLEDLVSQYQEGALDESALVNELLGRLALLAPAGDEPSGE